MNAIDRFFHADLDNSDFREAYDNYIDEIHRGQHTLIDRYGASRILEEIDPVAYRCGFADWIDSLDDSELGGRYECDECGDRYSDEDEAEECCAPDEDDEDDEEEDNNV